MFSVNQYQSKNKNVYTIFHITAAESSSVLFSGDTTHTNTSTDKPLIACELDLQSTDTNETETNTTLLAASYNIILCK